MLRIGDVTDFLISGAPKWGEEFSELFNAAFLHAWVLDFQQNRYSKELKKLLVSGAGHIQWHLVYMRPEHRRRGFASAMVQQIAKACNCQMSDMLGDRLLQKVGLWQLLVCHTWILA